MSTLRKEFKEYGKVLFEYGGIFVGGVVVPTVAWFCMAKADFDPLLSTVATMAISAGATVGLPFAYGRLRWLEP